MIVESTLNTHKEGKRRWTSKIKHFRCDPKLYSTTTLQETLGDLGKQWSPYPVSAKVSQITSERSTHQNALKRRSEGNYATFGRCFSFVWGPSNGLSALGSMGILETAGNGSTGYVQALHLSVFSHMDASFSLDT